MRSTHWHTRDGHSYHLDYAADYDGEHYVGRAHNACGTGLRKGAVPKMFPETSHNGNGSLRWGSPTNMPRWASRLTLAVDDVTVTCGDEGWQVMLRISVLRQNIDEAARTSVA